jgi:hypothetical protein
MEELQELHEPMQEPVRAIRVLRTEFYFDRNDIATIDGVSAPSFPGIGVAWFKNPEAPPSDSINKSSRPRHLEESRLMEVSAFLDAAL